MTEGIWHRRWRTLREAGVTREQALLIADMLDDARAFGWEWLSAVAREKLEEVYGEGKELAGEHSYSLAEIRNGTGWAADTRFRPVVGEVTR